MRLFISNACFCLTNLFILVLYIGDRCKLPRKFSTAFREQANCAAATAVENRKATAAIARAVVALVASLPADYCPMSLPVSNSASPDATTAPVAIFSISPAYRVLPGPPAPVALAVSPT